MKNFFLTKKQLLILIPSAIFTETAFAQTPEYLSAVKAADSLYKAKLFQASASQYNKAFAILGGKGRPQDRYNAACSWSLAKFPDSAFAQLDNIVVKAKYNNLEKISSDEDLLNLHKDARWKPLIEKVMENKTAADSKIDKTTSDILNDIFERDQSIRKSYDELEAGKTSDPTAKKEILEKMKKQDAENLSVITKILDTKGFLGPEEVGNNASLAIFLVIQHADLATQEKYFPLLKKASEEGKLSKTNIVFLEDRISVGKTGKQLYGSQISIDKRTGKPALLPIVDESNVDRRRASVGLEPLSDYAKRFGINYIPKK
jgi:hypothetical protein